MSQINDAFGKPMYEADTTNSKYNSLQLQCYEHRKEIDRLNERIKRLKAVTNDPHALWVNWLRGSVALPVGIGDVREYQDRIKRLEEAGDKLYSAIYCGCLMDGPCKACSDAADMWDEIKEVKP
jgi:hypothetical protein